MRTGRKTQYRATRNPMAAKTPPARTSNGTLPESDALSVESQAMQIPIPPSSDTQIITCKRSERSANFRDAGKHIEVVVLRLKINPGNGRTIVVAVRFRRMMLFGDAVSVNGHRFGN